jgi:hypothetical protein
MVRVHSGLLVFSWQFRRCRFPLILICVVICVVPPSLRSGFWLQPAYHFTYSSFHRILPATQFLRIFSVRFQDRQRTFAPVRR